MTSTLLTYQTCLRDAIHPVLGKGAVWSTRLVDVVDSRCRIGEMAARIMTKLGTVALQVGASFSSES